MGRAVQKTKLKIQNRICPKCSGTDIHMRYDRNYYDCTWGDKIKGSEEHLHFYCRRCSYDWIGPLEPPRKSE